jgi:hypothetical protein
MDAEKIAHAKRLLATPKPTAGTPYGALGAAALAAMATVTLAGVLVLGPGVRFDDAVSGVSSQP